MSCAVAGKAGTCSPVPAGAADPATVCANGGAASCGATGFCDGSGGCQLYPAGTQCAAPSCPIAGTDATLARTCDGAGSCKPATTQSCGTYACNGLTCNAACAGNADCSPGNVCQDGACGKRRLGQLCLAGGDCESGNCVDGVCCSAGSCGNCQSCNVLGSAGGCHAVAAGTDEPHGGCAPAPPCGRTGKCDGLGACAYAPVSTSCGTASCVGSTFTPVGACDGAGACKQASVSCSPYLCGAGACLTGCTADLECAAGFSCPAGSCTDLAANAATCASGADCLSNHCLEGVCCASASCGSCRTCARSGMAGTCAPVLAGDPDPTGACRLLSCSDATLVRSACDGAGACASKPVTDCTPFACDGVSKACKTSCADAEDCASGYNCSAAGGGGAAVKTCRPRGN
jgi:hypothetical protein